MGACQSRTRNPNALFHTGKQGQSSHRFVKTRSDKKLRIDVQKESQATTNPQIFSPSERTRETIPTSPSSSLLSPAASTGVETRLQESRPPGNSGTKIKLLVNRPTIRSNDDSGEIEVQLSSSNVDSETRSTSAVASNLIDQFQKLKVQAQLADRATRRRKHKEQNANRKEMFREYRSLWQDYEEIQDKVLSQSNRNNESVSFLKDSNAWYFDFREIHRQQQAGGGSIDPTVANLSLLSQASIKAQKKFFEKKSIERKQSKKRKGMPEKNDEANANQSVSSSFQRHTEDHEYGPKRAQANGYVRYTNTDDYNVGYRDIPSSSTQNKASHSGPLSGTVESTVPAAITLGYAKEGTIRWRKKNPGQSARRLDFASSEKETNPYSEMSKEHFLMMCSPKSGLTDGSSAFGDTDKTARRDARRIQAKSSAVTNNPFCNMSTDQFMMVSSPQPVPQYVDESESHTSAKTNTEQVADESYARQQTDSNPVRHTINYISKGEFLRMSIKAGQVPTSIGGEPTDDSQMMSKISCEDTFESLSRNQTIVEDGAASPEVSTSIGEDEEEDDYVWDGHMDDEEFWDMDNRRQSLELDQIDELASQVSSQISTLLTKFREDNNSIHT